MAVAISVLVLAYLVLWPKPPEAAFPANPFVMEKVRLGEVGELQTLTVTNVGERPMPIQHLSVDGDEVTDFVMEEDGCGAQILQPQGTCAVLLRFQPGGKGQRQAVLQVHAEMPDSPAELILAGEGTAPVLAVEPPAARFGSQDVGASSAAVDLAVVNEGTATLLVSRVTLGGSGERDFRLTRNNCSKTTLAPGEACSLRMVFVPRAAGPRQAELVFDSDAMEPVPTVQLEGEGIWTGAAFAVEPRALDFGRHLVGTGRIHKSVQVVNRQGTTLRALRVGLADSDRGFSLGKQSCTGRGLAPGESCRIEVGFEASAEGDFRSLLQISQRDVGTLGIELEAQGVAPRWVLQTSAFEFGEVRVGAASEPWQVELRNEGTAGAKITGVEVRGGDGAAFELQRERCTGREVEPDSDCTLSVVFRPRREGDHRGELLLHAAAGVSPQRVSLTARASAPRLSLDREIVDFDRVHRTTMRQVELGLANRGTASLQLGPFSLADNAPGNFEILGGSCLKLASLPAGERCSITIAFAPTAEGRSTARLEIEHDGISGPHEVPMAGIGLPPPIPRILIAEASLDFGPQPVGSRSSILTLTLRAGGTGFLEFREFSLEGANAGDFHIVPATCDAAPSLQPGSDCAVGMRFMPTAGGTRAARLVIRHNAGSGVSTVELKGEGLGGPPG